MKKRNENLLLAEEYFFSAAIACLIKKGKSAYEIGNMLNAHTDLIRQYIFTDDLHLRIGKNNTAFIKKIKSQCKDEMKLRDELWKYNVLYYKEDDRYFMLKNFPKTIAYWIKKNNSGELVFGKIFNREKNINAAMHLLPLKKKNPGQLLLFKTFEIINSYLDGCRMRTIQKMHGCTGSQLQQVIAENNLPNPLNKEMMLARIADAAKAGASYDFIIERFKQVSRREIKLLLQTGPAGQKILALNILTESESQKKNRMKNKAQFSAKKSEILKQKICLRYFSLGNEINEIVLKMQLSTHDVTYLLKKERAIA